MPPLVLHGVPDEELYVGSDGIQRPYAMVFPSSDGNPVSRARRVVAETGSFEKSTRRSRSRTGTPAVKKEDPTLSAADVVFSSFFAQRVENDQSQRKSSIPSSSSQPNLSSTLTQTDGTTASSRFPLKEAHKEPTEVILRGFRSSEQQYAAIREYERIAGRICEDYPRDAPLEQRKYKSDLRDPASMRQKPMSAEEKAKALRFAGGEHWIKVTFESAEAAEIAVESSPQMILDHIIYAEVYRGVPPTVDEAVPVNSKQKTPRREPFVTQSLGFASGSGAQPARRHNSTLPKSFTTPAMSQIDRATNFSLSPTGSNNSSQTIDSGTVASTTTSATVTGQSQPQLDQVYCRRIPTAKRAKLLPAEQALLPQLSWGKTFVRQIPIISWFNADFIGDSIPKNDQGEFDWSKASLYWRVVYWVDSFTGWFDVCNSKDD